MTITFQFASLGDFFAMGGYSFYVWLAFGISFGAVAALIWQSRREEKQLFNRIRKAQSYQDKLSSQAD